MKLFNINKTIKLFLPIYILLTFFCTTTFFAFPLTQMTLVYDQKSYEYSSPEITMVLNNTYIDNSQLEIPPVIIDGRVYIPTRYVFEQLGADVQWNEPTSEVFITYNENIVVLQNNRNLVYVNGADVVSDNAPKTINDRLMIPVRFVSEQLGFKVDWDEINKEVSVTNIDTSASGYIQANNNSVEETPIKAESPVIVPVENKQPSLPTANLTSSVDVSTDILTAITYPETSVMDLILPTDKNINEFRISANSEISKVTKTLLQDNRLIIDIYNADMGLKTSNYTVLNNNYIKTIRTAQNQVTPEKITRVVFDILSPVNFSVSFSEDRKQVIVRFEQNQINDVNFSTDGITDTIKITSQTKPTVTVNQLMEPDRLVIDIPLGIYNKTLDLDVAGYFASHINASKIDSGATRIVVNIKEKGDYKIIYDGNAAIINIFKPTYKNIYYTSNTQTITIPKSSGVVMDINSLNQHDDYNGLKYTFTLPGDFTEQLGYGVFNVNDSYLKTFEIRNIDGKTTIVINENQILAYNITEDTDNYYIAAILPKNKYGKIIVLDPGHGGVFPGTSGFGVTEKDITLDICNRILALSQIDNTVKVYMTRTNDYHISTDINVDLEARAKMGDKVGDLFLSVHYNSFTNDKVNGTEVFSLKGGTANTNGMTSNKFANVLHSNLIQSLNLTDRGIKENSYVVLKNKIPSVLVEIGFLTNPNDAQIITSEEGRQKTANALYKSILEAFEMYKPIR